MGENRSGENRACVPLAMIPSYVMPFFVRTYTPGLSLSTPVPFGALTLGLSSVWSG